MSLRQLWPALTLRPSDFENPEKAARAARLVYETAGKAFQDLLRALDSDPRMSDPRVAKSIQGMGQNLEFVDNPQKSPGNVAYLLDAYHWTFGGASGSASSGGITPSLANALLDGVAHSDTVAQTPSKGSLIAGKTSPGALWDELVAGTNGYALVCDSSQTLGLKYVDPNNVLLDGAHHTDTDGSWIPVNGDMITRSGGTWSGVSIGAADKFLKSTGSQPGWQASLAKTGAAKVDAVSQAAAIGATNLIASASGFFTVHWYMEVTAVDVTAGTINFQVNHTDDIGATSQASTVLLGLTATGRDKGVFQVYCASGALSYQTNLVGIVGTARYNLYVRVLALG